jgi:hypothetical protein
MQYVKFPELLETVWLTFHVNLLSPDAIAFSDEPYQARSSIGRKNLATVMKVQERMIPDPRADFQHPFASEIQLEAIQVLEPGQIMLLVNWGHELSIDFPVPQNR